MAIRLDEAYLKKSRISQKCVTHKNIFLKWNDFVFNDTGRWITLHEMKDSKRN